MYQVSGISNPEDMWKLHLTCQKMIGNSGIVKYSLTNKLSDIPYRLPRGCISFLKATKNAEEEQLLEEARPVLFYSLIC